jgi:hypothetical protein
MNWRQNPLYRSYAERQADLARDPNTTEPDTPKKVASGSGPHPSFGIPRWVVYIALAAVFAYLMVNGDYVKAAVVAVLTVVGLLLGPRLLKS